MDRSNYYFTNPKYVYSYVCLKNTITGEYSVFEMRKDFQSSKAEDYGTPIASADTVDGAIASAEKLGIKHYLIKEVVG